MPPVFYFIGMDIRKNEDVQYPCRLFSEKVIATNQTERILHFV